MKWKFITISQTGSGSKRDCEEGFGSDHVTDFSVSKSEIFDRLGVKIMKIIGFFCF